MYANKQNVVAELAKQADDDESALLLGLRQDVLDHVQYLDSFSYNNVFVGEERQILGTKIDFDTPRMGERTTQGCSALLLRVDSERLEKHFDAPYLAWCSSPILKDRQRGHRYEDITTEHTPYVFSRSFKQEVTINQLVNSHLDDVHPCMARFHHACDNARVQRK